MISTTTLRQSVTPPRLLGRVSAINILSYGARPIGAGLGAIVGGLYGAETCLYLAAAIFAAQALVILMSPAVSLARQPEMVASPPRPGAPGRQATLTVMPGPMKNARRSIHVLDFPWKRRMENGRGRSHYREDGFALPRHEQALPE